MPCPARPFKTLSAAIQGRFSAYRQSNPHAGTPSANPQEEAVTTPVATYYQLLDVETDLELGVGNQDDIILSQSVGVAPVSGEGAVVTWMARCKGGGSVTYTVTLNGTLLNTYTVTSADRFALQETTSTSHVNQGDNELIFEVTSGNGTLGLGDVMLWHRVNV
jgi:hypothetical protein